MPLVGTMEVLDHGLMLMTEVKDQKTLKHEQSSYNFSMGSKPSEGNIEFLPSSSARRPGWYAITLMVAREQGITSRRIMKESEPLMKF